MSPFAVSWPSEEVAVLVTFAFPPAHMPAGNHRLVADKTERYAFEQTLMDLPVWMHDEQVTEA